LLHDAFAWHLEDMATAKRTSKVPKVSRISRDNTLAYARKQKAPPDGGGGGGEAGDPDDVAPEPPEPSATNPEDRASEGGAAVPVAVTAEATTLPEPGPATLPVATEATEAAEEPARARTSTVTMPMLASIGAPPAMPEEASIGAPPAMPEEASIGAPPAMPEDTASIEGPVNVGSVEDPTRMPGPREIPGGSPDDPAAPPGHVPAGDSRSMRRRTDHPEFALVYRMQTYVISRFGVVGQRGQWRVVEYPTSASASHAYAKECSRFVSEGFSDYRA
jgi:hypothetical protein